MPYAEYSSFAKNILLLTYEQKLNLLSILVDSLKGTQEAPDSVTVRTREELFEKLKEAEDDLNNGRVLSCEEVRSRLEKKFAV